MKKYFDNLEKADINSKNNKNIEKNNQNNKFDEIKGNFVHQKNLELNDLKIMDDIISKIKGFTNDLEEVKMNTNINKNISDNNQAKPLSKKFVEDKIDHENIDNNKINNKQINNNNDNVNIKSKCCICNIF